MNRQKKPMIASVNCLFFEVRVGFFLFYKTLNFTFLLPWCAFIHGGARRANDRSSVRAERDCMADSDVLAALILSTMPAVDDATKKGLGPPQFLIFFSRALSYSNAMPCVTRQGFFCVCPHAFSYTRRFPSAMSRASRPNHVLRLSLSSSLLNIHCAKTNNVFSFLSTTSLPRGTVRLLRPPPPCRRFPGASKTLR